MCLDTLHFPSSQFMNYLLNKNYVILQIICLCYGLLIINVNVFTMSTILLTENNPH